MTGMDQYLTRSILKTLAFFAAQDQALTVVELHCYLLRVDPDQRSCTLAETEQGVGRLAGESLVIYRKGLVALIGQEELVDLRHTRYINSMRLLRKAGRWIRGLRHVPYVRAAAISGSVAHLNASGVSDIDLLIITDPKRMFLARFLVSVYFQLFGGRRYGEKIAGRFCLNHYLAGPHKLDQDRNEYTATEYVSLLPVFGKDTLKEFHTCNRSWLAAVLLRSEPAETHVYNDTKVSFFQRVTEAVLWMISGPFERLAAALQKSRIRKGDYILVSSHELSFHPNSKGQRVLARFRQILSTQKT